MKSLEVSDFDSKEDLAVSLQSASSMCCSGVSVVCTDLTKTVATRTASDYILSCGGEGVKKDILKNVSIAIYPGEIMGILGPSGGGKTTLLNMIAQRSRFGWQSGHILFNGLKQNADQVKTFTNYVMAHDKLLCYLTVEETLNLAAELKLPLHSKAERHERVQTVMRSMGLMLCKSTYIGGEWKKGISTGEMKRVSIAIELLDDPKLLLLDEPTSGLDSALALEVMQVLVNLARAGRSIIMTVHQPRSQVFGMVDRMVLLNKGRVVYEGPPNAVKEYFLELGYKCPSDWNPADFILDVISDRNDCQPDPAIVDHDVDLEKSQSTKDDISTQSNIARPNLSTAVVNHLPELYKQSAHFIALSKKIDAITKKPGPCPSLPKNRMRQHGCRIWLVHFVALWKRFSYNSFRNPLVCCVAILILALEGLILGGVFFQLAKDVYSIKPAYDGILDSSFTKAYLYGVDGKGAQPFVDMALFGTDGNGSQPLMDLMTDTQFLLGVHKSIECIHKDFGLAKYNYPPHSFDAPDKWPDRLLSVVSGAETHVANIRAVTSKLQPIHYGSSSVRSMLEAPPPPSPATIESDLVSMIQVLDFLTLKWEKRDTLRKCMNAFDGQMAIYTRCFLDTDVAGHLVQAGLQCIGLPAIDITLLGGGRRQLAANSDTFNQYYDVTKKTFASLASCNNDICTLMKSAKDMINESIVTVTAVLNLAGCLFFAVANLGFASYDALLTFPQERAVFNHETANGLYGVSSYFLAKNLADLPFQLIPSLTLATVYYWMVGLSSTAGQFFTYFGISASVTYAAYGFGYFVSAGSPRMEISVLIAPLTLVLWLTLAGFFLRDPQIPAWIDWFKYLSFYRWGFFSLISNQFPPGGYFGTLPNEFILFLTGITDSRIWYTCLMTVMLGTGFRVGCFIFLKFFHRKVGIER